MEAAFAEKALTPQVGPQVPNIGWRLASLPSFSICQSPLLRLKAQRQVIVLNLQLLWVLGGAEPPRICPHLGGSHHCRPGYTWSRRAHPIGTRWVPSRVNDFKDYLETEAVELGPWSRGAGELIEPTPVLPLFKPKAPDWSALQRQT